MPSTTRSQAHRLLAIETALGEDVFWVHRLTGVEELSRLFLFEVELRSRQARVSFDDIVGTNATVRLELPGGGTRFFNGFVASFERLGTAEDEEATAYRAVLRPWFWFLSRAADCRMFQDCTSAEIVDDVFGRHGFSAFRFDTGDSYATREYCVQYRETDLNFVSRLLEEEGCFYAFEHDNGTHELVVQDTQTTLKPVAAYEEIPFYGAAESAAPEECISAWVPRRTVQTGAYSLNDYNFESPTTDLFAKASAQRPHALSGIEVYDYPGLYTQFGEGDRRARVRLEELQSRHEVVSGTSNARGLTVGRTFKPLGIEGEKREFLVVRSEYRIGRLSENSADDEQFTCSFQAIPAKEPFRPARECVKPVVEGPQTAVVVGPEDEEIYPDEYGRVVVQFHWDRESQADENSSCWVRVAQVWAGKHWGAMHLPRIGQEVIVDFLEGDPDRPIITGRVYNAQNMPPYELPGEKTKSTIKSNSSKGGGGFNEIRFDDAKDDEQIFVHAQKDEDVRVENDSREWIGNNRHLIVKTDQIEHVEGDKHSKVDNDRVTEITGDENLTVSTNQTTLVKGAANRQVGGDKSEETGGDWGRRVKGDVALKGDKNWHLDVGKNQEVKAAKTLLHEAGTNMHHKAGLNLVLEAGTSLTIKAGGSFIVLGAQGVAISGPLIKLNSGGAPGFGPGANPASPASPAIPDTPMAPEEADEDQAGQVETAQASEQETPDAQSTDETKVSAMSSAAQVLLDAAESGLPFCEQCTRAAAGTA